MSNSRWKLIDITPSLNRFRIFDCILNKSDSYFMPRLKTITINGNNAIVDTNKGKQYLINLENKSRQLVT